MTHFTGPDKHRSEVIQISFDFSGQVPAGTTILAGQCICTVTVFSGTDATPSAILSGSPTVVGTTGIRQRVVLGVLGVIYQITMKVTLSSTAIYQRDCYVAIVPDDPQVSPPAPSAPSVALKIIGTPPSGEVLVAYTFTWTAIGGTGTGYVFTVDSGSVPTGTALNVSSVWTNDTDAGTPSVAATYPFVLRVTDSGSNTTTASESILIRPGFYGYVANGASGNVSVINRANTVVATVGFTGGNGVCVTPDRAFAYVAANSGKVYVISASTLTLVATITVGASANQSCVMKPDGTKVFVTNPSDQKVYRIDVATNLVDATYTYTGINSPFTLKMHPTLDKMYIADPNAGVVVCLNTVGAELGRITVSNAQGLGISPDGNTLYAGVFGGLRSFSTVTYAAISSVNYRVGFGPNNVAVTLDGLKAYVSDSNYNTVAVVNTATFAAPTFINMGVASVNIATHPITGYIYVCAGTVQVIDPATDTVATAITVGSSPQSISFP